MHTFTISALALLALALPAAWLLCRRERSADRETRRLIEKWLQGR